MPKKSSTKKNKETAIYKKWWFWVILVLITAGIGGGANVAKNNNENTNAPSSTSNKGNNYAPGEEFMFDGLALNLSPSYSFAVIDNMFSEDNGKTVVVIPTTIKNNSSEAKSLNMYSYKGYGVNGVELTKPSAYFMDDSVDFGGNLQPGASYTKNLYFLYDGNGEYKIEFGYYKTEASVTINISK